jgi:hypothetical protein
MTATLRRIGSAVTIAIATLALLHGAANPAAADGHTTGDACAGVDHSGAMTPPSPSTILLAVSSNLDQGTDVSVMLEINGSIIEGFGFVDQNGRFGLVIPIYTYGDYKVVSITATTRDGDRLTFPADSFGATTITIGPDEITCSTEQLTPLAAPTALPASTPAQTETATQSPTATTTATATTTPSATATTTQTDDGAGLRLLPLFLIGAGLLVALVGTIFFWGLWPLTTARTRPRRSTPPRETPTVITPEAREVIQGIYAGADAEGVRIAGLARIVETSDTLIGHKDSPGLNIGQTVEISVALDANGKPIPRIEDRDEFQPASSVMVIRVTPNREYGGEFWRASVQVWDVDTGRLQYGQSSGSTSTERADLIGDRSEVEAGNDPEFHESMLELEASTVADAVSQALRGAASSGNVVPPTR